MNSSLAAVLALAVSLGAYSPGSAQVAVDWDSGNGGTGMLDAVRTVPADAPEPRPPVVVAVAAKGPPDREMVKRHLGDILTVFFLRDMRLIKRYASPVKVDSAGLVNADGEITDLATGSPLVLVKEYVVGTQFSIMEAILTEDALVLVYRPLVIGDAEAFERLRKNMPILTEREWDEATDTAKRKALDIREKELFLDIFVKGDSSGLRTIGQ